MIERFKMPLKISSNSKAAIISQPCIEQEPEDLQSDMEHQWKTRRTHYQQNQVGMNQERKKELAPLIKSICKKHGIKATLSAVNGTRSTNTIKTLNLNIKSGCIDLSKVSQYIHHHYSWKRFEAEFADNTEALAFLSEVFPAMNIGNFWRDRVGEPCWHSAVTIGWRKPYILNIN